MYYNAAITILKSAVNGCSTWSERWNKVRVFDYYATDDFDYDNEKEAFDLCIDAYDSCIKCCLLSYSIFDNKVTKQGTATDEYALKMLGHIVQSRGAMYQSSNKSPILRILRTLQRTNNKRRLFP